MSFALYKEVEAELRSVPGARGKTGASSVGGAGGARASRVHLPPSARPSPARPDTYDLGHDQEPRRGAEEFSVVGEAAAGGGEVLREGAGSGGDRVRARALLLFHRRAGSWPGSSGTLPPLNDFPGHRIAGQGIAAARRRANPGDLQGQVRECPHTSSRALWVYSVTREPDRWRPVAADGGGGEKRGGA